MITKINPNEWIHHKPSSTYNRNVYHNEKTGQYILETCHEFQDYYTYDFCTEWGGKIEYIGIPTTDEWLSIFERDDAVELDSEIW